MQTPNPVLPSHAASAPLRCSSVRGFTLLELLATIAVAAVLAAVSIPMYRDFVRTQRIKTAAFDLNYALILARGEALKRNGLVSVTADSRGWSFGWSVKSGTTTLFANATATYPGANNTEKSYLSITTANGSEITYNGIGRLQSPAATFKIASAAGTETQATPRCVSIDLSGMPRSTVSSGGVCQ